MIPVSIIVLAEASIMTTVGTLLGGEGNLLITELKPKVYFLLAGPPAVLPLTTSPHLLNRFKHVIPIKIGGYIPAVHRLSFRCQVDNALLADGATDRGGGALGGGE